MGQWTEANRGHAVWNALEALGPAINEASGQDNLTSDNTESLARLHAVLAFCGKRLAASDPLLTPPATLDTIGAQFTTATTALAEFSKAGEASHLASAIAAASTALVAANTLPVPQSLDELTGLGQAAAKYQTLLSSLATQAEAAVVGLKQETQVTQSSVTSLGEAATKLRSDLTTMQQELATLTTTVSTLVSKHEELFSQAEAQRVEAAAKAEEDRQQTFQTAITSQLNEFDAAQSGRQDAYNTLSSQFETLFSSSQQERQNQHNSAEETRQAEFTATQTARLKEFNELVGQYQGLLKTHEETLADQAKAIEKVQQASVDTLNEGYKEAAQKILDDVNEHKSQVEKVAGVVGNLAVTSGYARAARGAGWAKWFWQFTAVLALGCLSWFAVSTAATTSASWQSAASHLISFLPIIVLAAYAGSQADKHHQIQKRNQKLALEFEAIGPYLAGLPLEMQQKFRVDVGERTFGRDDGSHVPEAEKSPTTAIDLAGGGKIVDALTSLVKAIKP